MNRIREDSARIAVVRALLNGTRTAPELIACTGVTMTTVYASLRALIREGWLTKTTIVGTGRRRYEITAAGERALRFILELAAHEAEEDSLSSSPTAARSSL
jgi:DNA-binding PadR family transcriptional regulator